MESVEGYAVGTRGFLPKSMALDTEKILDIVWELRFRVERKMYPYVCNYPGWF